MSGTDDKKKGALSIESIINEVKAEESGKPKTKPGHKTGKSAWEQIVTAATVDKELDTYTTHALNYDGEESTSRIIRGSEGIAGNLDRAVVDIIVGLIQKARKAYTEMQEGKDVT